MSNITTAKTPSRGKTPRKRKLPSLTDPVEVYCRIRPLEHNDFPTCLKRLSDTIVQLTTPENSNAFRNGQLKETQFTFQHVFDEVASQTNVFNHAALPLIDDVLHGKNGLLFTYGVTSSGKTHTMTGERTDPGILPRCLDVIFKSIAGKQALKYVFKPDKENWFEIQSEADAMIERQKRDILPGVNTPKTPYKNKDCGDEVDYVDKSRVREQCVIEDIEEDNVYSVFISLIEIYNKNIYDLLEDVAFDPITGYKAPVIKALREDARHNMYVHQAVEVEVTSPEDAFQVLFKGQKKRRMAHTVLNAESSRSHSVFNVRIVQAPLNSEGREVLANPSKICVSQLSLVDLAGSERCKRTNNTGDRLAEAGNINNDLMSLRTCIETLRDNQRNNASKIVSFRNTRLTHLFRNYFEGEGKVRMIVCVNPHVNDYDETMQVMSFAELTQKLLIARPATVRFDTGFTPGRRKLYKENLDKISVEDDEIISPPPILFDVLPPFPPLQLTDPADETLNKNLESFIQDRINRRSVFQLEQISLYESLRASLVDQELESSRMQERIKSLETTNRSLESAKMKHLRKAQDQQKQIDELSQETRWKTMEIKELYNKIEERDIQIEKDKLTRSQMKSNFHAKLPQEKQQNVKELIEEWDVQTDKDKVTRPQVKSISYPKLQNERQQPVKEMKTPRTVDRYLQRFNQQKFAPPTKPKPSYNFRHRRSKSTDTWIDHRPIGNLDVDTLLQPQMKKKRSVTNLSNKDAKSGSKYLLTHQELDTDGEVETCFIKGDMLTTPSGGTSVLFDDFEVVTRHSAGDRKRKVPCLKPEDFEGEWTDTEDRCKFAAEHHGTLKSIPVLNSKHMRL